MMSWKLIDFKIDKFSTYFWIAQLYAVRTYNSNQKVGIGKRDRERETVDGSKLIAACAAHSSFRFSQQCGMRYENGKLFGVICWASSLTWAHFNRTERALSQFSHPAPNTRCFHHSRVLDCFNIPQTVYNTYTRMRIFLSFALRARIHFRATLYKGNSEQGFKHMRIDRTTEHKTQKW